MKRISLVLITLMLTVVCTSAKDAPDAIYHLISKTFTLNDDGSVDYHYRKELQLFSNDAFFKRYGETLIAYNAEYQTLKINESYTIRKDGSKVQTPDNAFNPSLPAGCTDCQRVNSMREMVVTHTALEYDATIVLDYTIHSEQPFFKELVETVNLYENAPIERYEVKVVIPVTKNLNYELLNFKENLWKVSSDDRNIKTYEWMFTPLKKGSMAQKPADAYLPADALPSMWMTTLDKPSDLLLRLSMQNAFLTTDETLVQQVADEVIKDKSSGIDKALALRNYVADMVHTNDLPLCYMNYIVASPNTVLKTNCANPVEKNRLLQAMLSSVGLKATFGLLENHLTDNPEGLVRVAIGDSVIYLSATQKTPLSMDVLKIGDAFVDLSGTATRFEMTPVDIKVVNEVSIKSEKDKQETDCHYAVQEISAPAMRTLKSTKPKACTVSVQDLGNNYYQVLTDDGKYGCPIKAALLSRDRKTEVSVPVTNESYTYRLTIPSNAQWVTLPSCLQLTYDFGTICIEIQKITDKTLQYTRQLTLTQDRITPKQYKKFRTLIGQWNTPTQLIYKY